MDTIRELINDMYSSDTKKAYEYFLILQEISNQSPIGYEYWDSFLDMIRHKNSYVRTKGLLLLISNAKWDNVHLIDACLQELLTHILDDKPITSRQFIKALPTLCKHQPHLINRVIEALQTADPKVYSESMYPLVAQDIHNALDEIQIMEVSNEM